jgi:4-hydroxy-4-methyl-2-oxoglutarate aldolase
VPTWRHKKTPAASSRRGQINVPVVVGGMLVNPGDLICGDRDGLISVPPHLGEHVAQAANQKKQLEDAKRIQLATKKTAPP